MPRILKEKPDLRTAAEWEAWARAKIAEVPRVPTLEEMEEAELGDCIEFDPEDPRKQNIIKGVTPGRTPPNYCGKE